MYRSHFIACNINGTSQIEWQTCSRDETNEYDEPLNRRDKCSSKEHT